MAIVQHAGYGKDDSKGAADHPTATAGEDVEFVLPNHMPKAHWQCQAPLSQQYTGRCVVRSGFAGSPR